MKPLTRLEKLLFRLEAQHVCLSWAFGEIAASPGVVCELGLGHGRTYDFLRANLPGRDIYVFDREIDCFEDCVPPADMMFRGEIAQTLDVAAARLGGQAVLVHSDMGSYDADRSAAMTALLSRKLPELLAPGAILLSDLPLRVPSLTALPLPAGARDDSYHLFRKQG
jgi:hypothetical protein